MKPNASAPVAHPPLITLVCRALDEKKAGDVRVLHVAEQSSITDYLVIATGTSEPHLRALRVELEKVIDATGTHIVGMDKGIESGWLVVDAFDVMIHVFTPEARKKYALENLWKDAEPISVEDLLNPEAAVARKAKAAAVKKPKPKAAAEKAKATPTAKAAAKKKPTAKKAAVKKAPAKKSGKGKK